MIVHDAASNAFFLQGPSSSYVLGIDADGRLLHLHWGARVAPGPLGQIVVRRHRPLSPNPIGLGHPGSLDQLPQECPTGGLGDFRSPAVLVEHPDGTCALDLVYAGHRIAPGKPRLPGLPATYVEDAAEADTLFITLRDALSGVTVELAYTQFRDHDVVARSLRISNAADAVRHVTRAYSASLDLRPGERRLLTLPGAWARERQCEIAPLRSGMQGVVSRRGASSHQANPCIALLDGDAGEEHGEVRGMVLAYSGCFTAQVEVEQYATVRMQIGMDAPALRWRLAPGESFQAPEAVLVWSGQGLGGMSRTCHRLFRTRLVRGAFRDAPRPVVINNWEATYFDFDAERIVGLARAARGVGAELLVLDDGWFKNRIDDKRGLGDWTADERKLPGGLARLAERVNAEGLRFGLWFEPEMGNPDSDLHRAHPDWFLRIPGRTGHESRNQVVLDLGRREVREHLYDAVASVLRAARIDYVKWDMNRHLTEVWSPAHPVGEAHHRFILGLYELMERLTSDFPRILFESCSSGGGRFDAGLLHYMPQVWTSDNSDAICRLAIQHGTSIAYPLATMAAHISACPNHQVHRTTPLRTRGHVAFTGAFGFELDPAKLTADETAEARALVEQYRQVAALVASGDLYRLRDPAGGAEAAWMVVSPDRARAFVTYVRILTTPNPPVPFLRLAGLDPAARYRVGDEVLGGDVLMAVGLRPGIERDFTSRTWLLERV